MSRYRAVTLATCAILSLFSLIMLFNQGKPGLESIQRVPKKLLQLVETTGEKETRMASVQDQFTGQQTPKTAATPTPTKKGDVAKEPQRATIKKNENETVPSSTLSQSPQSDLPDSNKPLPSLTYIGAVKNNEVTYFYFKELNSNRIYKIPREIAEQGWRVTLVEKTRIKLSSPGGEIEVNL